jgi:protein quaking
MDNFNDSGNISANTSVLSNGSGASQNGSTNGEYTAEYLAQLLKDKRQLTAFPNVFMHVERLVDDEIQKVRVSLFRLSSEKKPMVLPEPTGTTVQRQEKIFVPVNEYPDYNFVGRILGPRGMTAKQLEQETGCKIMIRGKGSMRDKLKEEQNRGKPNWEHLDEALHVLLSCEDTDNRCTVKLAYAAEEISKLLVPAAEGEDELKRKQLMELAIINGTYRPAAPLTKLQLQSQQRGLMPAVPGIAGLPQSLAAALGAATGGGPFRGPGGGLAGLGPPALGTATLGAPIFLAGPTPGGRFGGGGNQVAGLGSIASSTGAGLHAPNGTGAALLQTALNGPSPLGSVASGGGLGMGGGPNVSLAGALGAAVAAGAGANGPFAGSNGSAMSAAGGGAALDLQMMASAAGLIYSPLDPTLAAVAAATGGGFPNGPYAQQAYNGGGGGGAGGLTSPLLAGEYPGSLSAAVSGGTNGTLLGSAVVANGAGGENPQHHHHQHHHNHHHIGGNGVVSSGATPSSALHFTGVKN